MRLWPAGHTRASSTTLLSVVTLLCSASLARASANPARNIAASQRNFRLGHPAAFAASGSAGVMSVSLPSQTVEFEGFATTPLVEPDAATAQLIRDAMDLFGARPSPEIFSRWDAKAVFADPICHATGARQYLAQWYGMPAAFSLSETRAWKLIRQDQNLIEYVQLQRYKLKGLGTIKDMKSTVIIQRNQNNVVTKFEDRWNHNPMQGTLSWPFRRLNALTLPWLISVPPTAKSAPTHSKDL